MFNRVAATFLRITLLAVFGAVACQAQGKAEDYQRATNYIQANAAKLEKLGDVAPHWINETSRFWYRLQSFGKKQFVVVDPSQSAKSPAFDHEKLAAALNKAARRTFEGSNLPFDTFDFSLDGKSITFDADQAKWLCAIPEYVCHRETTPDANEVRSPNGRWSAFVRGYNLWLRDTSTGQEIQLTRDGEKNWDYATPLPSLATMVRQQTQEPKETPGVQWAPDSSKLVTYRLDSRNAGRFNSLQFVPPDQLRPKAYSYAYPLPGEALPTSQLIVFDPLSGKRVDVQGQPLSVYYYGGGARVTWFKDSKRFYYLWVERGYKAGGIKEVDAETGQERALMLERAEPHVDTYNADYSVIGEGSEVLWGSDRDGWMHIYLYNGKTGHMASQVTKGEWAVSGIVHVDEAARQIYFAANGREAGEDPYFTHLYRVNFDGSGLQLLTPESANHNISFSPDGKYFVENISKIDLPTKSVLRRAPDGNMVMPLEESDVSGLTKLGWKFPEPFRGKAADSTTDIFGAIWRPSNFDASKKYPVIEYTYTGPHSHFVPKAFNQALGTQQSMAELGFIVVMMDGRGTTGRSRDFHNFSYRNLGGAFEDHVALIKQMAAKYPYMDLTRVGIYGTSAGGYGSAHAMLAYPEFYKVCVSTSGDHDPRLDKAVWNEAFQGYPVDESYVNDSNVTQAAKLQGHLLLEHGDIDDNVNPVETMRFADALMKANKDFDMLFVPNMAHGEGTNLYLVRRRWDYFVKYLLGVTPPKDFVIPPLPASGGGRGM
ncbi:MAG TPA: DPP IV N-terminal domain-containing protein [Candidatus Acidoferrales bacterium]|nr:DPP IV N-terminal domain-containing protein [Candidatus Acidoferrales bacterium]